MKALILSWLIGLQWTHSDRATETPEARLERLTTIAESVADLTRGDARKASFALVQFKRETDLDSAVQRCECSRHQCDARHDADGLTHRQRQVLGIIKESLAKRGLSPTVREIKKLIGVKSTNTVSCHLVALERCGYIRTRPGRQRNIELVGYTVKIELVPNG